MKSNALAGLLTAGALMTFGPALLSPAAAQTAPTGTLYTLKHHFAVGTGDITTIKGTMKMDMSMEGGPMGAGAPPMSTSVQFGGDQVSKIVGMKPDGSFVVACSLKNMKAATDGQQTPIPPMSSYSFTVDALGKVNMLKAPAIAGMPPAFAKMQSALQSLQQMPIAHFPDHPVKVGESWDPVLPSDNSGASAKVHCTLTGVENTNGVSVAVIKQETTMRLDMAFDQNGNMVAKEGAMMTMSGDVTAVATMNVRTSDGAVVRALGTGGGTIGMDINAPAQPGAPGGKMHMSMKMDVVTRAERKSEFKFDPSGAKKAAGKHPAKR